MDAKYQQLKEDFQARLEARDTSPFLFIGSGVSRRYLGLETWENLLKRFAENLEPYEYYRSTTSNDLPSIASMIANDFHAHFWSDGSYEECRKENAEILTNKDSALKLEISRYIESTTHDALDDTEGNEEISKLKSLNIDGFITTNWDTFLETLFPGYQLYIGQKELLFSNPQSIGEIYKIHGCVTKPNTLVLTHEDYKEYNDNNPYLASKLLTLFVEHPVVFLGYSISDPNIIDILSSIVRCLDADQTATLGRNLFFVDWQRTVDRPSIIDTLIPLGPTKLPITLISTDSFLPIYSALEITRHKLPARVLRYCKEQLYKIVKDTNPEKKISILDIDEIEEGGDDIEFVVGIGAISAIGEQGYRSFKVKDLIQDILHTQHLKAQSVVNDTIPELLKRSPFIPLFFYLYSIDITSEDAVASYRPNLSKALDLPLSRYQNKVYRTHFNQYFRAISFEEFISGPNKERIVNTCAFYEKDDIDLDLLGRFLSDTFTYFMEETDNYRSQYKKLFCFYDRQKYGWWNE